MLLNVVLNTITLTLKFCQLWSPRPKFAILILPILYLYLCRDIDAAAFKVNKCSDVELIFDFYDIVLSIISSSLFKQKKLSN
jgi:hypothetical protein